MRLNNLPKEVLESEFPNLVSKAIEKGYLILDNGDDGRQVIIARPTKDGKFHGKMYELNQPKDEVVFPDTPKFADEARHVDFLRWGGQTDSTFREDYNDNLIQMQHTINALVDDNRLLRKYIEDLQDTFKVKQDNLVKLISLVVSNFLDDNYYPKEVVDRKLQLMEIKIENMQQSATREPPIVYGNNNPSRTSSLPDDEDTNIDDQNLRDFIHKEGGD